MPLPRATLLLAVPFLLAQAPPPPTPGHAPPARHLSSAPTSPSHAAPGRAPSAHAPPSHAPVIKPHGPSHPRAAAPAPAEKPAPAAAAAAPPPPTVGSVTGMKLPRFAALHTDEVNMRAGPGTRYPIDWVYKRRDLPVEIEREFEVWRLITDSEGTKGWVHQATLTGRRSFLVTGAQRTLRRTPDDRGAPVAYLDPGVVGRIVSCAAGSEWCQLQVGDHRGYLKRSEFWGTYAGEAVNSG